MITEDHDELFDRVRGNLGEHFTSYMFIVMDDDGDLYYDYTNYRTGKMLVEETRKEMEDDGVDIIWDAEEIPDDFSEDEGLWN